MTDKNSRPMGCWTPIASKGTAQLEAAIDPLADLVSRFSAALLAKLRESEAKGRTGWDQPGWEDELRRRIREHIEKGDPRDVAAFAAFAWHHGWTLAKATGQPAGTEKET